MRYSVCVLAFLACSPAPETQPQPASCYIINVVRDDNGHVTALEENCGGTRIIKVKEVQ